MQMITQLVVKRHCDGINVTHSLAPLIIGWQKGVTLKATLLFICNYRF